MTFLKKKQLSKEQNCHIFKIFTFSSKFQVSVPGMIPAPMPGMLIPPQIRLGAAPVPPVGMPFMPPQVKFDF